MKYQVRTAVTALALVSGASLAVSCGAPYNGVKGTVVEAEHVVCGVELSMDNVAFDLQNTKGGASGSKSGSTTRNTTPKNDSTTGGSGGTTAGVGVGTAVAAGAVGSPDAKPSTQPSAKATQKKDKKKGCKEKWELEIRDSGDTIHEVKVDRRVYSACGVGFKFPSCAD